MTQTGFKLVNEPCRGVHFQDKLATLVLSFHLSTAVNYTAPHDLPKTVISDRRADRKFGSGKKNKSQHLNILTPLVFKPLSIKSEFSGAFFLHN